MMRLVPRSRRGTWMLAGAAWLTACAALWWWLPVVPRDVIRLPHNSKLLGFGPNGKTLLIERQPEDQSNWNNGMPTTVELIDADSGKSVSTMLETLGGVTEAKHSVDGRVWLLLIGDRAELQLACLDLANQRTTITSVTNLSRMGRWVGSIVSRTPIGLVLLAVSPNGRFIAFESADDGSQSVVVQDTDRGMKVGLLSGGEGPIAFAGDSNSMAVVVPKTEMQQVVKIVTLPSLEERMSLVLPKETEVCRLELSLDGSILFAHVAHVGPVNNALSQNSFGGRIRHKPNFGGNQPGLGGVGPYTQRAGVGQFGSSANEKTVTNVHELIVWDLNSRTVRLQKRGEFGLSGLSFDGSSLIAQEATPDSGSRLIWFDTRTAERRATVEHVSARLNDIEKVSNRLDTVHLSPDRKFVLIGERRKQSKSGLVKWLINKLGLASRFPKSDDAIRGRLFDSAVGEPRGEIDADASDVHMILGSTATGHEIHAKWLPDGRSVAVLEPIEYQLLKLWDIPPRKSLTWFAAGAAIFALPIALIARRRVRKLKAA